VATAALYTAVGLYFSWIVPGSIVSDQHAYGPIGTIMVLFEALVALGLAVHLGAVIGARYGAASPTAFGRKPPAPQPPAPEDR
jgi:membrane protein